MKDNTILSIIPVLDQIDCQFKNSIKTNKTFDTKKEFDKYKLALENDYERITNDSKYFYGFRQYSNNPFLNVREKPLTRFVSAKSLPLLFVNGGELIDYGAKKSVVNVNKIVSTNTQIIKEKININVEINSIQDLLKLIKDNPIIENVEYNINIEALHKIKDPLIELENMIGMLSVKENVIDQIIYYIQGFHKLGNNNNDFMHTVIYGPPGTGKTELAKLIGKIFSNLGILKKGIFNKVTRADLIAGYLGQTAIKTKEVIMKTLGGVLFIDEAYALGNNEKRDSFSKECIDTLCEALSDHKENIMVIIAGYEDELNTCFFSYNAGLESRFTWRFNIDKYSADELRRIFIKKVTDAGWSINTDAKLDEEWFKKNMDYFKYYGRDIETLFAKTKICHSRRVFGKSVDEKTHLNLDDINNGFKLFTKNDEVKSRKTDSWSSLTHMYS